MDVGIACDLRSEFEARAEGPSDLLEEYDSVATIEAIAHAIEVAGHSTRRLGSGRRLVSELLNSPPDLVFNIAEGFGTRSREAHVPAVCELLRIPVTHSDPLTCALTLDKGLAKRMIASHGLATPAFAVMEDPAEVERLRLRYPVIAKPLFEGSSMGVRKTSRAFNPEELRPLVASLIRDYREAVLVEEFLSGAEFTVGITGTSAKAAVLGVMEIAPRRGATSDFIYSLEVKRNYEEEVSYAIPPKRPRPLIDSIESMALKAYCALGCRDVARVDIRLDAAGEPSFLEINPLPGINPTTGDIVLIARGMGLRYEDLIARILASAQERIPG